jgi:hypothetical protein
MWNERTSPNSRHSSQKENLKLIHSPDKNILSL